MRASWFKSSTDHTKTVVRLRPSLYQNNKFTSLPLNASSTMGLRKRRRSIRVNYGNATAALSKTILYNCLRISDVKGSIFSSVLFPSPFYHRYRHYHRHHHHIIVIVIVTIPPLPSSPLLSSLSLFHPTTNHNFKNQISD